MTKKSLITTQKGFTIIELMIATSVFSVVLMLCTYGLLGISRTYTKGITTNRTQEAARSVLSDLSDNISFTGGEVRLLDELPNGSKGFCIGSNKYSYIFDHQLANTYDGRENMEQSRAVLRVDSGCSGQPASLLSDEVSGREMLQDRMQLARLEVCGLNGTDDCATGEEIDTYRITVRVVSGSDDLFDDNNIDNNCQSGVAGGQFCAVSELTTIVKKRVQ